MQPSTAQDRLKKDQIYWFVFKLIFKQTSFWLGKLSEANINHKTLKLIYVVSDKYCKNGGQDLNFL